jgi:hypothetical protein
VFSEVFSHVCLFFLWVLTVSEAQKRLLAAHNEETKHAISNRDRGLCSVYRFLRRYVYKI